MALKMGNDDHLLMMEMHRKIWLPQLILGFSSDHEMREKIVAKISSFIETQQGEIDQAVTNYNVGLKRGFEERLRARFPFDSLNFTQEEYDAFISRGVSSHMKSNSVSGMPVFRKMLDNLFWKHRSMVEFDNFDRPAYTKNAQAMVESLIEKFTVQSSFYYVLEDHQNAWGSFLEK